MWEEPTCTKRNCNTIIRKTQTHMKKTLATYHASLLRILIQLEIKQSWTSAWQTSAKKKSWSEAWKYENTRIIIGVIGAMQFCKCCGQTTSRILWWNKLEDNQGLLYHWLPQARCFPIAIRWCPKCCKQQPSKTYSVGHGIYGLCCLEQAVGSWWTTVDYHKHHAFCHRFTSEVWQANPMQWKWGYHFHSVRWTLCESTSSKVIGTQEKLRLSIIQ